MEFWRFEKSVMTVSLPIPDHMTSLHSNFQLEY